MPTDGQKLGSVAWQYPSWTKTVAINVSWWGKDEQSANWTLITAKRKVLERCCKKGNQIKLPPINMNVVVQLHEALSFSAELSGLKNRNELFENLLASSESKKHTKHPRCLCFFAFTFSPPAVFHPPTGSFPFLREPSQRWSRQCMRLRRNVSWHLFFFFFFICEGQATGTVGEWWTKSSSGGEGGGCLPSWTDGSQINRSDALDGISPNKTNWPRGRLGENGFCSIIQLWMERDV